MPNWPTQAEADAYAATRAASIGIDPNIAVAVRRSESQIGFIGDNGTSFSPYMLHYGGGLGDVFTRQTGLDARDPRNWKAATDFALQWAKVHGWTDFHGAARVNIGVWEGITQAANTIGQTLQYYFPIVGYNGDPTKTYHTPGATDLFAAAGTAIRNVVNGRVISVGSGGPGGNNISIKGDDGREYYYAHLKDKISLNIGDYVPGGQKIGEVGNTGDAAGKPSHLHLGIGYGIQSGTGATGGTGVGFDAQSFLSGLLVLGGAKGDPIMEATAPVNPIAGIGGGLTNALDTLHQGIINYVQDRAAAIVLLVAGIFLVLVGVWSAVGRSETVKSIIKTVPQVAGIAAMA